MRPSFDASFQVGVFDEAVCEWASDSLLEHSTQRKQKPHGTHTSHSDAQQQYHTATRSLYCRPKKSTFCIHSLLHPLVRGQFHFLVGRKKAESHAVCMYVQLIRTINYKLWKTKTVRNPVPATDPFRNGHKHPHTPAGLVGMRDVGF
jgi:hypothetical protein